MKLFNSNCTLCPLHEGADIVCVPGGGDRRADVFVVRANPTPSDASTELLHRTLSGIAGIDPIDCYFTAVTKCAVDEEREPTKAEQKICSTTYLLEELDRVKPRFVLLMGNEALKAVTGRSGITKHAGTIWHLEVAPAHTATVMAVLSPSAVLKNPKWASSWAMAMARFGRTVRGEDKSPKTVVRIVNDTGSLQWLLNELAVAEEISWDIETYVVRPDPPYVRTNFQEWHGNDSQIASIAFSWKEGEAAVVPLWHPKAKWKDPVAVLGVLHPSMTRHDCEYIGHNGKFDARWLHEKGVPVPQTFDTMLAAHMLDENRLKGLKPLSQSILGADAYDVGEELKNANEMPLRRLCIYNGKDTDYTLRLKHEFERQLAESGEERVQLIFRELMMPASAALVDIERRGVWLDPVRWQERHDTAVENRDKLMQYIQRYVPDELAPLNLNAPAQVGRLLFEHLELPIINRTKTGAPSTAETVLLRLADKHKVPKAMIKYRKWAKYLSTYLLPWWFEHKDSAGRIHSNYKLFGTVTGRLSGEGGIQQVPRDPFIRSIIGAEKGYVFLQADYSQVELRIAAMISNERRMLRQYARGEDIHMIRACRMTGKLPEDVTKEERKKAKAVNFGYIYGMGAKKFVTYAFDNYGIKITLEEAEADREGFFEDYPALRPWHERQRRLANRYQRVVSPLGRVRHLTDVLSLDQGVRQEAERQAINSPVQSFASDLMLIALVRLHRTFALDGHVRARIIGTVHDSILFEVHRRFVDWAGELIKQTMEDMDYVHDTFGTDVTVPIIADIEVGSHWGETEPWTA